MKNIYVSVDLGSNSIKIIVCEKSNKYHVLAASALRSKGIKRGIITDAAAATISLRNAVKDVEEKLGIRIDKVVVNVPIDKAEYEEVEGYSTITNSDSRVIGDDVVRTLQAAIYNKITNLKELVTILPITYTLDEAKNINNPLGLVGEKLGVKAVLVTVPKKSVYSVISLLESAGLEVIDINLGIIGDYLSFKTDDIANKVGAIVNIGGDTTDVAVFNKGIIEASEILEFGGRAIDNDISYIYKVSKKESKRMKEKFAVAHKRYSQIHELYETTSIIGEEVKINQYELSEVVMSRLEEMLKIVKKQIKLLTNREISYIIITGGVSELPAFGQVCEEVFGKTAIVANIETIGIRHNKYSSAFGMVKSFHEKLEARDKSYSMVTNEKQEKLTSTKKDYLNISGDSIIGKFFGYFFDS